MTHHLIEDPLLTRYLLGDLEEQGQEQVERLYFADDDHFARVLAAEEDLIKSYHNKTLSETDRVRFEKYYLSSPRRRLRADLQAALAEAPRPRPAPEPSRNTLGEMLRALLDQRLVWGAIAVLIVALASGLWLRGMRERRAQPEAAVNEQPAHAGEPAPSLSPVPRHVSSGAPGVLAPVPSPRPGEHRGAERSLDRRPSNTTSRERPTITRSPSERPNGGGTPPLVATATLIPNSFRAPTESPDLLVIRHPHRAVRLNLVVDDQRGKTFDAALWPDNDRAAARMWSGLKPSTTRSPHIVSLQMPAEHLGDGPYTLELQAAGQDGGGQKSEKYSFMVQRQSSDRR
jgi:anti-sigma factor RsiW